MIWSFVLKALPGLLIGLAAYFLFTVTTGYFKGKETVKAQADTIGYLRADRNMLIDTVGKYRRMSAETDAAFRQMQSEGQRKEKQINDYVLRTSSLELQLATLRVVGSKEKALPPDTTAQGIIYRYTEQQQKLIAQTALLKEACTERETTLLKKVAMDSIRNEYAKRSFNKEVDDLLAKRPLFNIGLGKKIEKARKRVNYLWSTNL